MRTNNSAWIQPVMSLIAHTDPGLFRKIDASDWYVTVARGPDDLDPLLKRYGYGAAISLARVLDTAAGVTADLAEVAGRPTWLNVPGIEEDARYLGVTVTQYAAATLVHEWVHHDGENTEAPAYDRETEFSVRMGLPALAMANQQLKQRALMTEH